MIQALADSLADALLEELPPERAYTRAALQTKHLPEPVVHFLERTLQEHVEHEMGLLHGARVGWVNYEAPDVQEAHDAFVRAAGKNAQIPAGEWQTTLRHTVRAVGAHLVRPRRALRWFVFQDDDAISVRRVLQRVRFFSAYSYFADVLSQYAEQREIERLGAERFAEMLRRIDRRMTSDYTSAQWSRLLAPLFAFMEHVPNRAGEGVPVPLLRAFFEEKARSDLIERLPDHQEALTREALRRALKEVEEKPAPQQASAAEPPAGEAAETDEEERSAHDEPGSDEPGSDEPVPLWKQFQTGQRRGTPAPKQERSPEGGKRSAYGAPSEEPVPRWQQFRGESSREKNSTPGEGHGKPPAPPDPLDELERAVLAGRGVKNRSFYVNKLFDGSREAYRETLRQLRGAESWSEAQRIVAREVFRKHQVNIYSDPAVSFTDAVQQRFR